MALPNATQHNTTQPTPQHAWLWYKVAIYLSLYLSYTYVVLVHATTVVDLAHIDQLLPPCARDLVR